MIETHAVDLTRQMNQLLECFRFFSSFFKLQLSQSEQIPSSHEEQESSVSFSSDLANHLFQKRYMLLKIATAIIIYVIMFCIAYFN